MPRIKETTVYQFDELSDDAKERARQWFREGMADDNFGAECVIRECADALRILGFTLGDRHSKQGIYYSGFWSQGDGACFVGSFCASHVDREKVAALLADRPVSYECDGAMHESPSNKRLHDCADELLAVLDDRPTLSASLTHRGYHTHKYCVSIDVDASPDRSDETHTSAEWDELSVKDDAIGDQFAEVCRELMRWIYRELESDYEWQNENEQVDDNIRANEYEFSETGKRE